MSNNYKSWRALVVAAMLLAVGLKANAYDFMVDSIFYNIIGETEVEVTYLINQYNKPNPYSGNLVLPATVTNEGVTYQVTKVGDYAFRTSPELLSVTVPEGVTSLGNRVFYGCEKLSEINLPASLTVFPITVADNSPVVNINFAEGNPYYRSVDGVVFDHDMTTLLLFPGAHSNFYAVPDGVTTIGDYSFISNEKISIVSLPNSVTTIGNSAFYSSSLVTINLPANLTSIGQMAFLACYDLVAITVDSANPVFKSVNGALFDKQMTTILQYPLGASATSYTLPEGVTHVGEFAISGAMNLQKLVLPEGVTSIAKAGIYRCYNLTELSLPSTLRSLGDFSLSALYDIIEISLPDNITELPYQLFTSCTSMRHVKLPSELLTIGEQAFLQCYDLESVDFPSKLQSIERNAFVNCDQLARVELPSSVSYLGYDSFNTCDNLTWVAIGDDNDNEEGCVIDSCAFLSSRKIEHVTIGAHVREIHHAAFSFVDSLKVVVSLPLTPPATDPGIFGYFGYNDKKVLYVHHAALEAYANADVWGDFKTIVPIEDLGDVNGDSAVSISDVTALIDSLMGGGGDINTALADMNLDGKVSVADVTALIDMLLSQGE